MRLTGWVAVVILAQSFINPALGELPEATMLAYTCAGCHGTNGSSVGPASPSIAGISREYFIESMHAYQTGNRPATIMQRIANGYSAAEIERMADFFSRQTIMRPRQTHDVEKADFGRRLHKKYCELCHEDGGRYPEDDAGVLAGQWETYLRYTLQDFLSGQREMDKKMEQRLDQLQADHGEQALEALIQYYISEQ